MKLNKLERLKLRLKPVDFYKKIASLKPEEIGEEEKFFLKSFGIYSTKLHPEKFMIRIRISAGRESSENLSFIASLAEKKKASILITSRAQIELHNLSFDSVKEIFFSLEARGMSSWQTLSDNFRNVLCDPLEGLTADSLFDASIYVSEIEKQFLKNEKFVGTLPRKFNVALSGRSEPICSFFGNDLFFRGCKDRERIGFDVYIGGKNGNLALPFVFINKDDCPDFFRAVMECYVRYGPRENRTRARLFHLLEEVGVEGFRKLLYEFDPPKMEEPLIAEAAKSPSQDEFIKLIDGTFAYRYQTEFGVVEPKELKEIIDAAKAEGARVNIGCDQNLYIVGLNSRAFGRKSSYERYDILSCAGSRFCIYSLFDTKSAAQKLKSYIKKGIKIGYSGCLKGCARHILADIGFVGIRTNGYGMGVERGVRLYLGADHINGNFPARLIYWAVPLRRLDKVVDAIIDEYENSGCESFVDFAHRLQDYGVEFLALWFLAKIEKNHNLCLDGSEEELKRELSYMGYDTSNMLNCVKEAQKRVFGP